MSGEIALRPIREEDMELLYRVYYSTRVDELAMIVDWTDEMKEAFVRRAPGWFRVTAVSVAVVLLSGLNPNRYGAIATVMAYRRSPMQASLVEWTRADLWGPPYAFEPRSADHSSRGAVTRRGNRAESDGFMASPRLRFISSHFISFHGIRFSRPYPEMK